MLGIQPQPIADARAHLVSAIEACPDIRRLKQILARSIAGGLGRDPFVFGRVVAFSAASDISFAHLAFDADDHPSAFSYTVLIRAHSAGPTPSLSLLLFRRMLRAGLYPDRFAFPFLLRAAARAASTAGIGEAIHALSLRHGLSGDPHVGTSLLHAYSSWGMFTAARRVFDEIPERTTVTWNAIISSCARSTWHEEGISLLGEMISNGTCLNADTLIGSLSCCAGTGALAHGKAVHGLATRRHCADPAPELGTSLIHMYCKCGRLDGGMRVFEGMEARDASTWTAVIGGLAMHGCGQEAVAMFERMVRREGLAPDSLTFTSVLHACNHSGLVETGIRVFDSMKRVHGVEARMEHYGAMVDLLGRAGRLEEAEQMVESMPFEPNRVVWGSLLNACLINGDLQLRERLERRLGLGLGLGLVGGEGGAFYVGVSNAYARVGRWDEVGRIRERMVESGVRKEIGYSSVEVNGRVHKFLAGDTRHPITMEMHTWLCGMIREMMDG